MFKEGEPVVHTAIPPRSVPTAIAKPFLCSVAHDNR